MNNFEQIPIDPTPRYPVNPWSSEKSNERREQNQDSISYKDAQKGEKKIRLDSEAPEKTELFQKTVHLTTPYTQKEKSSEFPNKSWQKQGQELSRGKDKANETYQRAANC